MRLLTSSSRIFSSFISMLFNSLLTQLEGSDPAFPSKAAAAVLPCVIYL
jgi:hypothetical protein